MKNKNLGKNYFEKNKTSPLLKNPRKRLSLLTQVLAYVFSFGTLLFIQLIGIAMGTRAAPTIANIFMTVIDKMKRNCA